MSAELANFPKIVRPYDYELANLPKVVRSYYDENKPMMIVIGF